MKPHWLAKPPLPPGRMHGRATGAAYTLAVASVVIAVVIQSWLIPVFGGRIPFMLLHLVLVIAGWYGGLGPGLLATGLGAVAADIFLIAPYGQLSLKPTDLMQVGLFVVVGASISVICESMHRAQQQRANSLLAERSARTEAERANRMKDEFLSTLSHELRTPLTSILGWASLLRSGQTEEGDLEVGLETIERNANVQAHLIDELLDMSRIISGRIHLEMQAVDFGQAVHAAVDSIRPAAESKEITVRSVFISEATVSGDPARLQQVVWNLLTNAVKFTPKAGTIDITLKRIDSQVELSVADSGAGIKSDFLPHVFDRFRQGDASYTRRYSGMGLGLSIVKQLVELHGGSAEVESAGEGRGATFRVRLPLRAESKYIVSPQRDEAQRAVRTTASGNGHQLLQELGILVVDDEADARSLIGRILEQAGATVHVAGSVSDALELFERAKPQLVISDISMPDADGYELISRIRNAEDGNTPAIALTAFARDEDRERALEAGFHLHIAKPVDPGELITAVARLAGATKAST